MCIQIKYVSFLPRVLSLTLLIALSCCLKVAKADVMPQVTINQNSVTLFWTAPGDDGDSGRAAIYDIRYSPSAVGPDTTAWWENANGVSGEPIPTLAEQIDSFTIMGLEKDTVYYIALKAADEVLNWSEISNIVCTKYFPCADVNYDSRINIIDITYLINYLYHGGLAPAPGTGDINNTGNINLLDVTCLLQYLYKGGAEPDCT